MAMSRFAIHVVELSWCLCALFTLMVCGWIPRSAFAGPVGRVVFVEGAVQIIRTSLCVRVAAPGDVLNAGDAVVTGAGAKVRVEMTDGTLVSVEAGTQLQFDEFTSARGRMDIHHVALSNLRGSWRAIGDLIDRIAGRTHKRTQSATNDWNGRGAGFARNLFTSTFMFFIG